METQEYKDFIAALQDLKSAVHSLHRQSLETNKSINDLLNHSHLRSTLTLLQQDIALRRTLELL